MNEPQPNMLLEITRGLITCAGWWVLFYKFHHPPTKARRIVMLISLPALYAFWYWLPLTEWIPQYSDTLNGLLWALIIFFFALLAGEWRNSFFTAVYYIGIEQVIDVTRSCTIKYFIGGWFKVYSLQYYMQHNLQYLFVLGWTLFYYWIMKKRSREIPMRIWIFIIAYPIIAFVLLTMFSDIARPLLHEQGINIYLTGMLFGLFFFFSNHFIFYLYIRQIALYDLQMQTQTLQSQLESQTRQNRLIEGAQKQAREIRHEMKNLLFALQIELRNKNYEGIEKRLNTLLGEMKQYELKSYTAVLVIDAMIAYKGEKLGESGAACSVSADPLYVSDELAYDIASLLAITLDNATDAIKDVKDAAVRLNISRWKNLVFITVSNPLTKPLKYCNGELQSTKDKPGHGLGLQALRRIIERYSGEVQIKDKDGVFSLEIMLMAV